MPDGSLFRSNAPTVLYLAFHAEKGAHEWHTRAFRVHKSEKGYRLGMVRKHQAVRVRRSIRYRMVQKRTHVLQRQSRHHKSRKQVLRRELGTKRHPFCMRQWVIRTPHRSPIRKPLVRKVHVAVVDHERVLVVRRCRRPVRHILRKQIRYRIFVARITPFVQLEWVSAGK